MFCFTAQVESAQAVHQLKGQTRMSVLPLPQLLRRNAQGAIEFTRRVFPGDSGRQLHNLIFSEALSHPREEFICNFAPGYGHSIGILKRQAFSLTIEIARCVIGQRINLVIRNSKLTAHGSINVLSKLAAVKKGDAAIDQRSQFRVN
jgi:hypothetical protein